MKDSSACERAAQLLSRGPLASNVRLSVQRLSHSAPSTIRPRAWLGATLSQPLEDEQRLYRVSMGDGLPVQLTSSGMGLSRCEVARLNYESSAEDARLRHR